MEDRLTENVFPDYLKFLMHKIKSIKKIYCGLIIPIRLETKTQFRKLYFNFKWKRFKAVYKALTGTGIQSLIH